MRFGYSNLFLSGWRFHFGADYQRRWLQEYVLCASSQMVSSRIRLIEQEQDIQRHVNVN